MRLAQIFGGLAAVLLFPNQVLATEPLPQHWVSAGGALSEWVVELGGEARLVGVDTTSLHPASLSRLPSIGYQRQLAAEGILSLQPQLLLGTEEMGPPPVLAQLKAAGVQVEVLPSTPDLSTLAANLQRIGTLLGEPQRASARFDAYRAQLQRQADWLAQAPQPAPRVLLGVGHAGGSPLAAGRGPAGAWLVEQAGGRNLPEHEGYKTLSTEALLALDPEVLVIADRRLQGDAARDALLAQNPALAATTAARTGRLLTLDPTLLVGGLGPRVPDGLAAMSAAFYPARQPLTAEASPTP